MASDGGGVMGYASRTGTKRNLEALRKAGWSLLVSARGVLRTEGFPYALDNGAWTAHQQGTAFDEAAFVRAVELLGADADWVVAPDIVGGGGESLAYSMEWMDWLRKRCKKVLIAVQDGMVPQDLAGILSDRVGVAVGGSTEWKELQLAKRVWQASTLHVLRVNTARRIRMCHFAGADSFDGSSASRYVLTLPMLDRARRQPSLWSKQ